MLQDSILIATGLIVGAMNAIAGGGMLIGFPMLVALGVPPLVANATGSVITAPGQLASALGYRSYIRKIPLTYAWLLLPLLAGSISGSLALRATSAEQFAQIVPALVGFGVALFAFQPLLHFHLHRHFKGRAQTALPLILFGLAMIPLGYYGGYFGTGFGFILLAFLGFTSIHDAHVMNAMKNIAAVCLSSASLLILSGSGLIDWRTGAFMAIGSVIGGYMGSRMAQHVNGHWLRLSIVTIGILAVGYLLHQAHYEQALFSFIQSAISL